MSQPHEPNPHANDPLDPAALDGDDLIRAICDERATNADRQRLAELVRRDPALKQKYIDMMVVDAMLRFDHAAELAVPAQTTDTGCGPFALPAAEPAPSAGAGRIRAVAMAAAVLLAAALIAIVALAMNAGQTDDAPLGEPVAVLFDSPDAIWGRLPGKLPVPDTGDGLPPGRYELTDGSLAIDFNDGTAVRIAGPAAFELVADDQLSLYAGRLIARVTDGGAGFRVNAPGVSVVDLGTEFGVSVGPDGASEVFVFDGAVEAQLGDDAAGDPRRVRLTRLQAKRFDADGAVADIPFDASTFAYIGNASGAFGYWIDAAPRPADAIDFTDAPLHPHPFQDGQHGHPADAQVLDDGRTLRLAGNAWKAIPHHYEVTPRTVLAFEFRSDRVGELAGIGFMAGPRVTNSTVGVFLTQFTEHIEYMHERYADYQGPDWKHFEIPVGRHFTGPQSFLMFVADDDVNGDASAYFRDVRLYEAEPDDSDDPAAPAPALD